MDNSPYLNQIRDLKVLRDLLNQHEATLKARAATHEAVSVKDEKAALKGEAPSGKPSMREAS